MTQFFQRALSLLFCELTVAQRHGDLWRSQRDRWTAAREIAQKVFDQNSAPSKEHSLTVVQHEIRQMQCNRLGGPIPSLQRSSGFLFDRQNPLRRPERRHSSRRRCLLFRAHRAREACSRADLCQSRWSAVHHQARTTLFHEAEWHQGFSRPGRHLSGTHGIRSSISRLSSWSAVCGDEMGHAWDHAFAEKDIVLLWQPSERHLSMVSRRFTQPSKGLGG